MTTFKPARRTPDEPAPMVIGVGGASGSGKTFTALEIATGLAGPNGRIAVIDSENRRAVHYADRFRFDHADIKAPFTPQAYENAIVAADRAGYDVILVDSFSHEWEGEGGVRDWADRLEAGYTDDNGRQVYGLKAPAQWKEPKQAHKKLVNRMLTTRAHIVVCLRAEEKMKIEQVLQWEDDAQTIPKMWKGKQSAKMVITPASDIPINERWVPICEKRFPYELTVSLLLVPSAPGEPIYLKVQEQHRPAFPLGKRIDRKAGAFLAAWARGETPGAVTQSQPSAEAYTIEQAKSDLLDARTLDDLKAIWIAKRMGPYRGELETTMQGFKAVLTPKPTETKPAQDGYEGV